MTTTIYWISTALTALGMLFSAYAYLMKPELKEAFAHMGFPDFFRVELAVAKIIGVALLVLPVGMRWKEWAYAGFTIVFISALIAHVASGDGIGQIAAPVVFLAILMVSYFSLKNRN
ncbi:DoxX family protein [Flavilitoribacter nigricans]|uniref:DoxX-like family protein n=1 Tax=Flavilitoribacter nigricans (strain ATCC 23147 / DSM 23189 / NBRC 102662 / NCIMB 1420 / SS-2) TaxID=1122177 RepID=A0A2D0N0A3_FLAN2|nr:DoxX family protein [Flavilitoribacter nigricans]PHN01579.1 DoxX-like family protein [Flavilitoribacter nigricans DSM 23189 = NBRC 102662]